MKSRFHEIWLKREGCLNPPISFPRPIWFVCKTSPILVALPLILSLSLFFFSHVATYMCVYTYIHMYVCCCYSFFLPLFCLQTLNAALVLINIHGQRLCNSYFNKCKTFTCIASMFIMICGCTFAYVSVWLNFEWTLCLSHFHSFDWMYKKKNQHTHAHTLKTYERALISLEKVWVRQNFFSPLQSNPKVWSVNIKQFTQDTYLMENRELFGGGCLRA